MTGEQRQPSFAERLNEDREATRVASWMPTWLKIGKDDRWICKATNPPFTTRSFHRCLSDEELLDRFGRGDWRLGQAFFRGDLCFINQADGGDEWLVIKRDTPFESIAFGWMIRTQGREGVQVFLDRIRAASVEECRDLEY